MHAGPERAVAVHDLEIFGDFDYQGYVDEAVEEGYSRAYQCLDRGKGG